MHSAKESDKLLENFISNSEELVKWLHGHAYNFKIPDDLRSRLATSCFHVALDHHESIVLLTSSGRWASAFSLVRIMVEAHVKGLWIAYHATTNDLELLVRKDKKKDFGEMVKLIENDKRNGKAVLSLIKSKAWSGLSNYVHTGMVLLSRYHEGEKIEAKFTVNDIIQMLNFANSFGLLVGHSMNLASGTMNHLDDFESKMTEYNDYSEEILNTLDSDS